MIVPICPDEFKQIVMKKLDYLENKDTKYLRMVRAFKYFVQQNPTKTLYPMQTKFFKHNDMLDRIRKTDIHKLDPI